jgi:Ala-tRNA(Pro) deacylase
MQPYEAIIALLKSKQAPYKEVEHEPIFTCEESAKVTGFSVDGGAKSLLLKAHESFILVVLAGGRRLDSKKLKKKLGVKYTRFATPQEVEEIMGCRIGSCYPFGSVFGVRTHLDGSLLGQKEISFNPGLHHKTIKIKLDDYLRVEPVVHTDIAKTPTPAGETI